MFANTRRFVFMLFVAPALVSGCVRNIYSVYYRDLTGLPDGQQIPGYIAPTSPVQIFSSDDVMRDVREARRRGYQVLGVSEFNGPPVRNSDKGLRRQAALIGAQAVIISTRYNRTETAYAPFALPANSTSRTNAQATAYGSGGWANAYGTSTTQTTGSVSVPVPYSVTINDVTAVFLAKVKSRLGMLLKPATDEMKRELGSNKGAVVDIVVEDTSAYKADVFPGDYLLSVGGDSFYSGDDYTKLLEKYSGQSVDFTFLRDGKVVIKTLRVEPLPPPVPIPHKS